MADVAERPMPWTVADFDACLESSADAKNFELIEGYPCSMGNPTETHEQIVANIGAPLKLHMDGRGCRTYQGGMRVQATGSASDKNKFRPDILVRCGERSNQTFVTDPVIIVETISPSTMDTDRGVKLKFYKNLPSLVHILLVYADQMRVEHYSRAGDLWKCDVLTQPLQQLNLSAVAFTCTFDTVYFDIAFDLTLKPHKTPGES